MKIRVVDENVSKVEECTPEEWKSLRELLSYPNQVFVQGQVRVYPVYLVHGRTKLFPTGLLPLVKKEFQVLVDDFRNVVTLDVPIRDILEEHQQYLVKEILSLRRCICSIPTGGGKSFVLSYIAAHSAWPTCIVVPTREILVQIQRHLQKLGCENLHILWGDKWDVPSSGVILTTSGTLNSRYEYYEKEMTHIRVLLCDEAHFYGADSFFKIAHLFPNANYRVGFSATPMGRSDNADIRIWACFSPYVLTYKGTIERVAPLEVLMLDYKHLPTRTPIFVDPEDYEFLLVDERRMSALREAVRMLKDSNLVPYVVFVDRVAVGARLSEMLGIPLIVSTSVERKDVFDRLRDGELEGIVTTIGWVGLDIPNLRAVINFTRETTPISLGQKAGRVRRKTPEKELGIVVDFWDDFGKLPRRWARRRANVYKKFGNVRVVKV